MEKTKIHVVLSCIFLNLKNQCYEAIALRIPAEKIEEKIQELATDETKDVHRILIHDDDPQKPYFNLIQRFNRARVLADRKQGKILKEKRKIFTNKTLHPIFRRNKEPAGAARSPIAII